MWGKKSKLKFEQIFFLYLKVSKLYVYPFKNARQYLDGVIKYPPPAMDRVKDNLKNEDDVRKEDSLEMKTHTAPPLRPSVVLVFDQNKVSFKKVGPKKFWSKV